MGAGPRLRCAARRIDSTPPSPVRDASISSPHPTFLGTQDHKDNIYLYLHGTREKTTAIPHKTKGSTRNYNMM